MCFAEPRGTPLPEGLGMDGGVANDAYVVERRYLSASVSRVLDVIEGFILYDSSYNITTGL
jgi:hypothetical protein